MKTWRLKIGAKILLSRLPISMDVWRRLGIFRPGAMHRPLEAFRIFSEHMITAGVSTVRGQTVLELGPGDSVATALIAKSLGADASILVDSAPLAITSLEPYFALAALLKRRGLAPPDLSAVAGWDSLLEATSCRYLTAGLASLEGLGSETIDFAFSNAALEHVRKRDFLPMLQQLRRVLKPTAVSSHQIDLRDHLANGLNNLRFSERVWESELMANSGFYTNRISKGEILKAFHESGFDTTIVQESRWDELPLAQTRMSLPFRHLPAEELATRDLRMRACPI